MSAVETYIETETERVERWRMEELLRVGGQGKRERFLASRRDDDSARVAFDVVIDMQLPRDQLINNAGSRAVLG